MIMRTISSSGSSPTRAVPDVLAVSEDRQELAERIHLRHAVGDENDGSAARLGVGDDLTEPVDVPARQRRCRLVEQQQLRLA